MTAIINNMYSNPLSWVYFIFFIIVVAACCSSLDNNSKNTQPKRKTTTRKRSTRTYSHDSSCECPSCSAPDYDGYCEECGYPDVNQGWVGENY